MNGKIWVCLIIGALIVPTTTIATALGTSKSVTITYYFGKEETGVERSLAAQFERETGIKVKLREMPPSSDVQRETITRTLMEEMPADVIRLDTGWISECAAAGWLRPLDDLFTEDRKFLPGPVDGCTYKGKIYAVPLFADFGLLYYRADLLDKYGFEPPETWLYDSCGCKSILTGEDNPNLEGFVFQAKQYEGLVCCFLEFVWSNNGAVYDDYGRVVIDSDYAVEALTFMCKLVEEGLAPKGVLGMIEEDTRGVFQDGRAIFMRNWPYAYDLVQGPGSKVKGEVGIAPLPHGPHGEFGYACLGGWNLAMPTNTRHPKEAWEFIQFMTSYDAQKRRAIEGAYLPTRKALYIDGDVREARPYFSEMGIVGERSKPRPVVPYYTKISETLQLEVQRALLGQKSPKAALSAAAREIGKLKEVR